MSFGNLGSLKSGDRRRPTLGSIWRGEERLATTYWLYGVVINGLIIGVVGSTLVTEVDSPLVALAYLLFAAAAGIFVIVAVWRSAGNYTGRKLWMVLARIVCVIAAVRLVQLFFDLVSA